MTIAYFDCFSGISGDMTLGALVDVGVPIDTLRSELAKLNLPGYEIKAEKVMRSGIAATKVHVMIEHDGHHARHLSDILRLIENSSLSNSVKEKSSRIFTRLGEAEAKVHGTTIDKIHFHEVGAVDSIVDIVGAVIGLEFLGISGIIVSSVNVGSGTVRTAHGMLPIPAPATAEMLKGIPFYESSTKFELTTPTGAAIISTLGKPSGRLKAFTANRIAYGAGEQDFPGMPNVLRIMIGESPSLYEQDSSILIETNIDDMNPQIYEHVIQKLLQAGAHDAYLTPIIMKKGRSAIQLSVLTEQAKINAMLDVIFSETTSIGVRMHAVERKKLSREVHEVGTRYGKVRVKVSKRGEEAMTVSPEYEDCKRIAEEKRVALKQVMEEAKAEFFRRDSEDTEKGSCS